MLWDIYIQLFNAAAGEFIGRVRKSPIAAYIVIDARMKIYSCDTSKVTSDGK